MRHAFITGLAGPELGPDEALFLRETEPVGIILFARNCVSHEQIRRLVNDALQAIGSDEVLTLIDQEGGRVQRLRPPLGRALPPGRAYLTAAGGDVAPAAKSAELVYRLLADDLRALGLNTDCAPVLDVPVMGSHNIIGDRAYATAAAPVAELGLSVAKGLAAGGVLPVIKHIPGHGRAVCDSHIELPTVDASADELAASDFAPFKAAAHLPAAMTAHVVYSSIDPDEPATTSSKVISEVIRGAIGFDGLLMSDDVSMQALTGSLRSRAERALAAGCDVALHCNGRLDEMQLVASGVPSLDGEAARRFDVAWRTTTAVEPYDKAEAEAALAQILDQGSAAESV
ncbi:Beta-hexosaminidase [Candidatus Filomicrobium marinum]|uniref:beta-N-acetylhexosaminidase n=1 Tax=Candidatus Filomicrobium marinum TaxID=1608628 RepID=A0A0D6JGP1_9HYPH|nr:MULTISPECIES: beta-N-acetylhexosaminidase [Filomicrobium]MCV0369712.1 beta-N-acetylhexosaminidase [Filomicrobium sp.]CFX48538.1 Beta-hexosaminidase [Candidatus Filomicrobium marinum]CPR20421.1 Beta-hexosaminidase [Candidatus Filomicrobium marinum]